MNEISDDQMIALMQAMRTVAQAEIMPRFHALSATSIRTKTADDDLVTDADLCAEAALARQMETILGDIAIVGEEAVSSDRTVLEHLRGHSPVAIIDPVDGTWNFAHGVPLFGSILAIVAGGQTIAGLIHYPCLDDFLVARPGRGAWHVGAGGQSTRIAVAVPSPTSNMHGFVPLHMYPAELQSRIAPRLGAFARTTTWRCSAFEYRMLATGAMSFCANAGLAPWDHAAGALIHAEAGGYAGLLTQEPYCPTILNGILLAAPDRESWKQIRTALFEM